MINARFVKPLDCQTILRAVRECPLVVTVEEGALMGGFGSAVLEAATDAGLDTSRVHRLGIPDQFIEHGDRAELLAGLGLGRPRHRADLPRADRRARAVPGRRFASLPENRDSPRRQVYVWIDRHEPALHPRAPAPAERPLRVVLLSAAERARGGCRGPPPADANRALRPDRGHRFPRRRRPCRNWTPTWRSCWAATARSCGRSIRWATGSCRSSP